MTDLTADDHLHVAIEIHSSLKSLGNVSIVNELSVIHTSLGLANTMYMKEIRDLLVSQSSNLCPHGGTGFCMSCVTPILEYQLAQMSRDVIAVVHDTMRNR